MWTDRSIIVILYKKVENPQPNPFFSWLQEQLEMLQKVAPNVGVDKYVHLILGNNNNYYNGSYMY